MNIIIKSQFSISKFGFTINVGFRVSKSKKAHHLASRSRLDARITKHKIKINEKQQQTVFVFYPALGVGKTI